MPKQIIVAAAAAAHLQVALVAPAAMKQQQARKEAEPVDTEVRGSRRRGRTTATARSADTNVSCTQHSDVAGAIADSKHCGAHVLFQQLHNL